MESKEQQQQGAFGAMGSTKRPDLEGLQQLLRKATTAVSELSSRLNVYNAVLTGDTAQVMSAAKAVIGADFTAAQPVVTVAPAAGFGFEASFAPSSQFSATNPQAAGTVDSSM